MKILTLHKMQSQNFHLHQMQSHLVDHRLHWTPLSCLDREPPLKYVSHGQSSSAFHSLHMRLRCTLKEPMTITERMEHFWLPQRSRQTYWRSWLKPYICIQGIHQVHRYVMLLRHLLTNTLVWRNPAPSQVTMAGNKASSTRWQIIAPNSEAMVFLRWCAMPWNARALQTRNLQKKCEQQQYT